MRSTILAFSILTSPVALATSGYEIGNGGDAVVCRNMDGSIRRAEIVDYYEAKIERGIEVDLGTAPTWEGRLAYVLDRLEGIDPVRARELRSGAAAFVANTRFIAGADFPDVPDTGGVIVPAGCRIEQIAIQQVPRFPEDKTFLVNRDLWETFDESSKAGLVLHELLYREALRVGATNSRKTRYLNSILASPAPRTMSRGTYVQRLAAAEFGSYGLPVRLDGRDALVPLVLRAWERDGDSDLYVWKTTLRDRGSVVTARAICTASHHPLIWNEAGRLFESPKELRAHDGSFSIRAAREEDPTLGYCIGRVIPQVVIPKAQLSETIGWALVGTRLYQGAESRLLSSRAGEVYQTGDGVTNVLTWYFDQEGRVLSEFPISFDPATLSLVSEMDVPVTLRPIRAGEIATSVYGLPDGELRGDFDAQAWVSAWGKVGFRGLRSLDWTFGKVRYQVRRLPNSNCHADAYFDLKSREWEANPICYEVRSTELP